MPRPKFLDQPFFNQRTPRTGQSQSEYASPVVIHTRTRWHLLDWLYAVALVAVCAGIGVMLAWRG